MSLCSLEVDPATANIVAGCYFKVMTRPNATFKVLELEDLKSVRTFLQVSLWLN